MAENDERDSGLGQERQSPSKRHRRGRKDGGVSTNLPDLPKGQRRRVPDKTGEVDQPVEPKRRKGKSKPRRPGKRGYRGPTPEKR